MKRSTFSLLVTAAILVIGGAALWFLLIAPRLGSFPFGTKRGPEASMTPASETQEGARNSALNLYLTAPSELPDGASRADLTILKATLTDAVGTSVTFFKGAQRVTLQADVVQKTLSERIPDGQWTRLTLDISPAAELAYANGKVKAALIGKTQAIFVLNADVAVSRSLAIFGAVPIERGAISADKALIMNLSADPRTADTYVFGGFLLDPRGRGDIFTIKSPTLFSVIKEDLGFDLSVVKPGSSGFQPAESPPKP